LEIRCDFCGSAADTGAGVTVRNRGTLGICAKKPGDERSRAPPIVI
jgi:ribosomal protein L24E